MYQCIYCCYLFFSFLCFRGLWSILQEEPLNFMLPKQLLSTWKNLQGSQVFPFFKSQTQFLHRIFLVLRQKDVCVFCIGMTLGLIALCSSTVVAVLMNRFDFQILPNSLVLTRVLPTSNSVCTIQRSAWFTTATVVGFRSEIYGWRCHRSAFFSATKYGFYKHDSNLKPFTFESTFSLFSFMHADIELPK